MRFRLAEERDILNELRDVLPRNALDNVDKLKLLIQRALVIGLEHELVSVAKEKFRDALDTLEVRRTLDKALSGFVSMEDLRMVLDKALRLRMEGETVVQQGRALYERFRREFDLQNQLVKAFEVGGAKEFKGDHANEVYTQHVEGPVNDFRGMQPFYDQATNG